MQYRACHVLVNFRNTEQTAHFLREIFTTQKDLEFVDFVVVDNSHFETGQAWQQDFAKLVKFLNPESNLGYFGAAEFAREKMISAQSYNFVIVSNTDLSFVEQGFYQKLLLTQNKDAGCLAPTLVSGLNGVDTNPYMEKRPSSAKMRFYRWMFASYLGSALYQWLGLLKSKLVGQLVGKSETSGGADSRQIYAAHGAFMIFTREYFAQGGTFKHPCFLYNEEVTVAEFCRSRNLKIQYEPSLRVRHMEHGSTGLTHYLLSKNTFLFKAESAKVIYERYFRTS